jgi:hypothetical protein
MATELTIKLLQTHHVLHEPMIVQMQFVDTEKALAIPHEYDDVDVVTYYLLDERGSVIAQGDGYAARMRQGLRAIRRKQSDLPSYALDKSQPLRWGDDVLHYVDVPGPGRYAIKVRFALPQQGVAVESSPVSVTVQAGELIFMDAWRDHLPAAEGMIVQHIKTDTGVKTILTAPGSKSPLIPYWGGAVTLQPLRELRVAEGDYPDVDAHEDERFRWIAALEGKRLRLWSVNKLSVVTGDAFATGLALDKARAEIELPFGDGVLISRPVQHQDLSVSVYVAHPAKGGTEIVRWRFDRTGKALGTTAVLSADRKLTLVDSAAIAGTTFLAAATQDAAPLRLVRVEDNKASAFELLSAAQLKKLLPSFTGDAKFLRLNVDVKPGAAGRAGVVGVFVAATGGKEHLYLFKVPFTDDEAPDPARATVQKIEIESPDVKPEDLIPLQAIQDQRLQLHALFATKDGDMWHANEGVARKIAQTGIPGAQYARLYETGSGYLYALYPTREAGTAQLQLQQANPFK